MRDKAKKQKGGEYTVGTWFSSLPGEQLVKIGAADGNGFVYCGEVRAADLESLDRNAIARIHAKYERKYKRKDDPKGDYDASAAQAEIDKYIPLADRMLAKIYPSQLEDAYIALFDGEEMGDRFACDESDKPMEFDDLAAMKIVGAVLGAWYSDVRESIRFYKRTKSDLAEKRVILYDSAKLTGYLETISAPTIYKDAVLEFYGQSAELHQQTRRVYRDAKKKANRLLDWLCGDQFCAINDPAGVCERVVREVMDEDTCVGT